MRVGWERTCCPLDACSFNTSTASLRARFRGLALASVLAPEGGRGSGDGGKAPGECAWERYVSLREPLSALGDWEVSIGDSELLEPDESVS